MHEPPFCSFTPLAWMQVRSRFLFRLVVRTCVIFPFVLRLCLLLLRAALGARAFRAVSDTTLIQSLSLSTLTIYHLQSPNPKYSTFLRPVSMLALFDLLTYIFLLLRAWS